MVIKEANLFTFVKDFTSGLKAYWRGIDWLKRNKRFAVLLFIPTIIGFVALIWGGAYLISQGEALFNYLFTWAEPEIWWKLILFWLAKAAFYVGVVVFALLAALLTISALSAPIYEYVSIVIEKQLTNQAPPEQSIWESLKLIIEELKKVIFILLVQLCILIIPVVNIIGILVTALLLGWDFYDYPLARRGFKLKRRRTYVRQDIWKITGFGLWLCIPFVQFLLLPFAIAGGTLLAVEKLQKEGEL